MVLLRLAVGWLDGALAESHDSMRVQELKVPEMHRSVLFSFDASEVFETWILTIVVATSPHKSNPKQRIVMSC